MEKKVYFMTEDVVAKVADVAKVSKVQAREDIENVFAAIMELAQDSSKDGVQLPGKFTLDISHVGEKETRNPSTGGTQITPAHSRAKVKLAGKVKEALR